MNTVRLCTNVQLSVACHKSWENKYMSRFLNNFYSRIHFRVKNCYSNCYFTLCNKIYTKKSLYSVYNTVLF